MNILFTGTGNSGSWQIRGEQLGRSVGADVVVNALDVAAYDVAVLIKRPRIDLIERVHKAGIPLVYDVVDAWPQPAGNMWSKDDAMIWLDQQINKIKPAAIVAATNSMKNDLAHFGVPVIHLPHHARPAQPLNVIREQVQVIGYEGSLTHLGNWRTIIEEECERRGWQFIVNPPRISDVDIVVALRETNGYPARYWKSNVKLANAQATGTPFIGCRESGYMESSIPGIERWADNWKELKLAFDQLTPHKERKRVHEWMLSVAPRLEPIAAYYREWLTGIANLS